MSTEATVTAALNAAIRQGGIGGDMIKVPGPSSEVTDRVADTLKLRYAVPPMLLDHARPVADALGAALRRAGMAHATTALCHRDDGRPPVLEVTLDRAAAAAAEARARALRQTVLRGLRTAVLLGLLALGLFWAFKELMQH